MQLRERLELLNAEDTAIVCRDAKASLAATYGAAHGALLASLPCDSDMLRDLMYIRDVYSKFPLERARRVMLRARVASMLDRDACDNGDDGDGASSSAAAVVELLEDVLAVHGCMHAT